MTEISTAARRITRALNDNGPNWHLGFDVDGNVTYRLYGDPVYAPVPGQHRYHFSTYQERGEKAQGRVHRWTQAEVQAALTRRDEEYAVNHPTPDVVLPLLNGYRGRDIWDGLIVDLPGFDWAASRAAAGDGVEIVDWSAAVIGGLTYTLDPATRTWAVA